MLKTLDVAVKETSIHYWPNVTDEDITSRMSRSYMQELHTAATYIELLLVNRSNKYRKTNV